MSSQPVALPQVGSAALGVDFYLAMMRTAITSQFQYRAANYLYMLGMIAEPVIYLVVWSTIADQSGDPFRASRRGSSPRTTSSGRSSAT